MAESHRKSDQLQETGRDVLRTNWELVAEAQRLLAELSANRAKKGLSANEGEGVDPP